MEIILPNPSSTDLLSCSVEESSSSESFVDVAECLIDVALAKAERIEHLDVETGRVALRYSQRKAALAMRAMYAEWTVEADRSAQLLDRPHEGEVEYFA